MNVQEQIKKYIDSQPEPKRSDMLELHQLTLQVLPAGKLWFFDGKNSENKTIANPTMGYGLHTIKYANGTTRDFFQIGISANKIGISIHIIGITSIFCIWIALNLKPFTNHEGSLWWRRFYVRMLNASQPDPKTITSSRNGYKF